MTDGRTTDRTSAAEPCPRCGAPLGERAAFCPNCGLERRPAGTPIARDAQRKPRARIVPSRPAGLHVPRSPGLVAAAAAVGIAAIAVGAAIGLAVRAPDSVSGTSPSPVAVVPSASGSPAVTPPPSPEATPTPQPIPVIGNLGIGEVVVEGLELRNGPNETTTALGQLGAGARLFVIGPPEEDVETRWYRVAVVNGPYTSATCPDPATCMEVGWVGVPASGEEIALDEAAITCPTSPTTIAEIGALALLERLTCFGNGDLTATGTIAEPCCAVDGLPIQYTPEWLAYPVTPAGFEEAAIPFRTPPDSELELPDPGDVIRATGHFEDPAAAACRASVDPSSTEDVEPPPLTLVVLTCRTQLVITDYEVVD